MINSVYDYYLTTYAGKTLTSQDTHKKSELRNVYNNIVKISKRSPLYRIDNTADVQRYAIDLKETARELRNVTDAFNLNIDDNENFVQKKAFSSNESILDVDYIGQDNSSPSKDGLTVTVDNLATPQINTGTFLPNSECRLPSGAYSFDCSIGGSTYEFQFNINEGESNLDIQNKLARLFNRSGIGLEAYVSGATSGNNSLEIRSQATGIIEFTGQTFNIQANSSQGSQDAVKYFGLDRISNMPSSASFTIDGNRNTSASNTFTINNEFQITLKDSMSEEDEPVHIGFKQDIDTLIDNTGNLVDKYNDILKLAISKSDDSYEGSRLTKEIQSIVKRHRSELESSGIIPSDDGYLSLDKAVITTAVDEDGLHSVYDKLNRFKKDIQSRADSISINPMNYVNKTLISYPNPVRSFANPYMTSIYSGMMFNGYV